MPALSKQSGHLRVLPLDLAAPDGYGGLLTSLGRHLGWSPDEESDNSPEGALVLSTSVAYLAVDASQWGWRELRDYVISEMEGRFGETRRDCIVEASIFKAFVARWGPRAGMIARYAFEVSEGWWGGKPVTVNRFCKASDPFFAEQIAPFVGAEETEPQPLFAFD